MRSLTTLLRLSRRTLQGGATRSLSIIYTPSSPAAQSTRPIPEHDWHDKQQQQEQLTDIIRPYFNQQTPVVLRGAVSSAPAIQHWRSWTHLESIVDPTTPCHVEVGGNYATSQHIDLHFRDYLQYMKLFEEQHGRASVEDILPPSPDELIYLAQNDAFEGLYRDFDIPDFLSLLGEGKIYSCMVWMGPHGCTSPLHFDPMDNVLMQFVGVKRVYMYPPESHVYAGVDGNQSNTSALNPEEAYDLQKYPLAAQLPPALETTIAPGDLLFIPKKWWHYIRTLETSISINCWWR